MIAGLRGRIEMKVSDALLVDVGGVIYRVGTSAQTIGDVGEIGEPVRLYTHLFVREDQMTLYGFASDEELRLFETLIAVTGVGPRLACAILSGLRVELLLEAIHSENADLLSTIPGVGKKTAARLILELRGKLPTKGMPVTSVHAGDREAVEALRALGYTTAEASMAVGSVPATPGMTTEDRIIAALRELGQ